MELGNMVPHVCVGFFEGRQFKKCGLHCQSDLDAHGRNMS